MFANCRCKWLVLAFLMIASVGCEHSSCNCGKTIAAPAPTTTCNVCVAGKILTVTADPSGNPGIYYVINTTTPELTSIAQGTPAQLPQGVVGPKDVPALLPPTKVYGSLPADLPARNPQMVQTQPVSRPREGNTSARYDHSKDYTWVMGKLEYLYSKKAWRVRYCPADVEDDLGGCVTLIGVDGSADNLKDGQMVRVDGALVDPESKQIAPQYQVRAIKSVD